MADPFVAEIRMFGFNFAPRGWGLCQGQLISISQNTALFSLLGTNYGGNGTTNFALPNFVGRAPIHWGQGPGLSDYSIGEALGVETVVLTANQMPAHRHNLGCSTANANKPLPVNNFPSASVPLTQPRNAASLDGSAVTMAAGAVSATGGGQEHSNMQPYLGLTFCIAMQGVFPPRS